MPYYGRQGTSTGAGTMLASVLNFGKESVMLLLTRKAGERIKIGPDVWIVIHKISESKVSIGVDAPKSVVVLREEVISDGQNGN